MFIIDVSRPKETIFSTIDQDVELGLRYRLHPPASLSCIGIVAFKMRSFSYLAPSPIVDRRTAKQI